MENMKTNTIIFRVVLDSVYKLHTKEGELECFSQVNLIPIRSGWVGCLLIQRNNCVGVRYSMRRYECRILKQKGRMGWYCSALIKMGYIAFYIKLK